MTPPPSDAAVLSRLIRAGEFGTLQAEAAAATPERWLVLVEQLSIYTAELGAQQVSLSEALATAEAHAQRFSSLLRALPVAVFGLGPRGQIRWANDSAVGLLGSDVGALVGSRLDARVCEADRPRLRALLQDATGGHVFTNLDLCLPSRTLDVIVHLTSVRASGGGEPELLCVIEDHSEEHRLLRRLEHEVEHDALTGLLSRDAFLHGVGAVLTRTGGEDVGVIFIDVDRFKWVNDTHGHAMGDRALRALAQRLVEGVRSSDLVARVSGDEFAVALPGLREPHVLAQTAASLVDGLRDGLRVGGVRLPISISAGVARSVGAGDTAGALLKRADTAMYLAKESGRACWRMYDAALEAETRAFYETRDLLRRALAEDRLRLCAQPIRRLDQDEIVGHELLLRIEDGSGGLIAPGAFLEVARTSGELRRLGHWVRREALGLLASGRLGAGFLTLNVSPVELDLALSADLIELHRSFGLPPGRVVVEITEEAMLPGAGEARQALDELVAAGIPLALDDFGSGYASLVHLSELPLAWVKLDRDLVVEHAVGEGRVLRAILDLCRALGLRVIAEGIETEAHRDLLLALGCGHGQGWLLGRPVLQGRATSA